MSHFSEIFFNSTLVDVLKVFFQNSDEEIYQSKIVDSVGKALVQVQRALKRLESAGIITKKKSGNRIYYRANRLHPAFEDLKRAFLKTVLLGDAIKTALAPLTNRIVYAFIFGSIASGDDTAQSDIDLLLVGDLGLREIGTVLGNIRDSLKREVNPIVYRLVDFRKKIKENDHFIMEILGKPKIWLISDETNLNRGEQGYGFT